MLHIDVVHHGHAVPFHPVALQHLNAPHHLLKGAPARGVAPVGIVQGKVAIDADAHQEAVVLEEAAPVIVQQGAVGLYAVVYLSAAGIVPLQHQCPFVEAARL